MISFFSVKLSFSIKNKRLSDKDDTCTCDHAVFVLDNAPVFNGTLGVVGFGALMVLLIRFLASVIVWFIITIAIIGSIGKLKDYWTFRSIGKEYFWSVEKLVPGSYITCTYYWYMYMYILVCQLWKTCKK